MDVKESITAAVEETAFGRRGFLVGSGLLAAFLTTTGKAYADEMSEASSSASASAAAAAASGAANDAGADSGNTLIAADSSELRGVKLLGANSNDANSPTPTWNVADDELTDEILQRLADAEAENEQLRSDLDAIKALLNPDGTLPREVYYGAASGMSFDTTPAVLFNTSDGQIYWVTP